MTYEPQLSNLGLEVFERAAEYQAAVYDRIHRARVALEKSNIPYAVLGGNAVAAWVSSKDPSAARGTQDAAILIAREQLDAAKVAMAAGGFVYRHVAGIDMFLDGANGRPRDAIQIVFAGEKVCPDYAESAPAINEAVRSEKGFMVVSLEALIRMKLTSFRLKDQVHLQDMASVGLNYQSWVAKYPGILGERLQFILNNPEA